MRLLATFAALALIPSAAFAQAPMRSRTAAASAPAPAPAPAPVASAPSSGGGGGGSYTTYSPMRSRSFGGFGNSMPAPPGPPPGVRGRLQVAGSAPPMPVNVQCNCGGSLFGLGYTDLRGGFYYPYYALPISYYRLSTCDLRFSSPGYWPLIVPFSGFMRRSSNQMADTGRLDLVPYGDISGTTVSMTSLMAPKEAKKAYEKAVKRFVDHDHKEAVEYLNEAVTLHPEYAAAWTLLGQIRMAQFRYPAATAAFWRAIDADEHYVAPYAPLTKMLLTDGKIDEVYELSGKGLELNPYDTDLKYARAVTAFRKDDYQDAKYYSEQLVGSDDAAFYPDALFILASAVKMQGDFERAARLYGEYYAGRNHSPLMRRVAEREMTEARLAEYTLRAMRPALP